MMKRLFVFVIIFLLSFYSVQAQHKLFSLYYIHHNTDTPVNPLCEELKNSFNYARNYDNPTIFYLANLNEPIVVYIDKNSSKDDFDEFNNIISELQDKRYHDLDIKYDLSRLIELFNEYDFMNKNGDYTVSSMNWNFFINQRFWDLGYNERLVSKLFFCLDLASCPENFFKLKIFYSGKDILTYDKEFPFGAKNITPEINQFELLKL